MLDFHYHTPETLDEALDLLEEYEFEARPFAGGTALVVMMKQSLVAADHMISLERIPGLSGIREEADGLHIGTLTRHREMETSPQVREFSPLLAEVYRRVATVRIRNQATVGGSLAHADPAQDPPAGLIALDAQAKLVSKTGERLVPVNELFVDYYETMIEPTELLTEVIVPRPPEGARGVYLKFLPRTEDDYATVAVAALAQANNGNIEHLRVALASAGPTPIHATGVEAALTGESIGADTIREAARGVADEVDPLDDFRGSSDYKRDMAVVFTRRALENVLGVTS